MIYNRLLEQTQEDPDRSADDAAESPVDVQHLSRERARSASGQVALIVMDIDEFKAINDAYGHQFGDRALREVATALQSGLRSYDLCVRYAGDEFIVVLADCSREAAEAKRRELQQRVSEIEIEVRAGKKIRLGVSAGSSVYPYDGATYEALLASADHQMYRDKAARRGRIAVPRTPGPADFIPSVEFEEPPQLDTPLDRSRTVA